MDGPPRSVVLLALLVVLAGCGGSPALEPVDTPADPARSAGSTTTAGPPGNASELVARHRRVVTAAGSATVRGTRTIRIAGGDRRITRRTRAVRRVDLDSGRATVVVDRATGAGNRSGGAWLNETTSTYWTADGTLYSRTEGLGGVTYAGPGGSDVSPVPNDTAPLVPGDLADPGNVSYAHEGRGSVRGVEGYVFAARGPAAAPSTLRSADGSVAAFVLRILTDGRGLIRVVDLSVEIERDDRTVAIDEVVRYEAVGTTTVPTPAWLPEAKRELEAPGPTDVVTRTFRVEAPGGLVEEHVTARKDSLEAGRALGPVASENPVYRNDLLNRTRVGAIVRAYWLSAEDVERVRVVFHYADGEVPGNESSLTVVYDDRDTFLLDPIESRVDPDANTVTATIEDPDRLERLQGETMFVIDYPEYERAFDDL